MARLRHFAISVKDLEASARFYSQVFELKEVGRESNEIGSGVYLSDGVVNLALLSFNGERGSGLKDAKGFVGAHHFGFIVDDTEAMRKAIEENGGSFFFTLGDPAKQNFELKFKDPDGVIFDISEHGWVGTDGFSFAQKS